MAESKIEKVLFVCLGNICRSPLAEFVVKGVAEKRGLKRFHFESAGTGDWHVGGSADPRAAAKANEYGLDMSAHRAQQITARNFEQWDWFIAMDAANKNELLRMGVPKSRLLLMRQFEVDEGLIPDVPDPYYGGPDGFEDAYWMLVANAEKLLDHLEGSK